jgi:hypothetical protein
VHTTYSDGAGTVPEVAAAAREAGLQFVIISDHDTLQALEDGWEGYHSGCLALVGAELRVGEGHILALNLPPGFPVGRVAIASETLARVRAADGMAFFLPDEIAHFSWEKLRALPFTGMEAVNLHNLARQAINLPSLVPFTFRALRRGLEAALGLVLARPEADLAVWDRLARGERMPGIASVDAHGRLRLLGRDFHAPSYRQSFGLVQTHLLLPRPLTGSLPHDREQIYAALAAGRAHLVFGGGEEAAGVRFWASSTAGAAGMGDVIAANADLVFHTVSPSPKALFRLYRNGCPIAQAEGAHACFAAPGPGTYRVEVYRWRGRLGSLRLGVTPWVFTNAIVVEPARECRGHDGQQTVDDGRWTMDDGGHTNDSPSSPVCRPSSIVDRLPAAEEIAREVGERRR